MLSDSEAIWDNEYSKAHIIPSSVRESPSQALLLFTELLGMRRLHHALDAGCGNGRNSLYLAQLGLQVNAIDFSSAGLNEAAKRVAKAGFTGNVTLDKGSLEEVFPFQANYFDVCLDFYVFCHFLDKNLKLHYVEELLRVTRPGGYLITTLFSPKDEYYASLVQPGSQPNIVKDPANGIVKELYPEEGFKKAFAPPFHLQYFVGFEFDDMVLGKSYHRHILAMALQKQ